MTKVILIRTKLGDLHGVFAASMGSIWVGVRWRRKLTRLIPTFVVILGCLFILHGLNLGIPFVSPALN